MEYDDFDEEFDLTEYNFIDVQSPNVLSSQSIDFNSNLSAEASEFVPKNPLVNSCENDNIPKDETSFVSDYHSDTCNKSLDELPGKDEGNQSEMLDIDIVTNLRYVVPQEHVMLLIILRLILLENLPSCE